MYRRLLPTEEEAEALRARMVAKRRPKKKRSREVAALGEAEAEVGPAGEEAARQEEGGVGSRKKLQAAAPDGAAARPAALGKGLSGAAAVSVAKKEGDSDVYKKLFHTDKDSKATSRDLMMSTAGFRYGLA
jgi:hypothetical protein